MSDSLSSADRDARIAAIENLWECGCRGCELEISEKGHHAWLLAELRGALSREEEAETRVANMLTRADLAESACAATCNLYGAVLNELGEAKKDAERLDALEDWYVDSTGKRFFVGGDVRGSFFAVDPFGASDVRVMIDAERAARSVSLSENG